MDDCIVIYMSTGTQTPRTMGSAVAAAFLTARPTAETSAAFSASCAKVRAAQIAFVPVQRLAANTGLHLERDGSGFVLYGKGELETFDSLEAVAVRLGA